MGKKNRRKAKIEESPTHPNSNCRVNKETGQWQSPIPDDEHASLVADALGRTEDPLQGWEPPKTEDCPICLIPQPLNFKHSYYFGCCGKLICLGCKGDGISALKREMAGSGISFADFFEASNVCPFCRQNYYATPQAERVERELSRAESGSIEAMFRLGMYHQFAEEGCPKNMSIALDWYKKASDAGHPKACHLLGAFYREGIPGVVDVNLEEALIHYQRAAELGHLPAFQDLVDAQIDAGASVEETVLNTRKAMMCGVVDDDGCVAGNMKTFYRMKFITKEEYAYTLKVHQQAIEERDTPSRKEAVKFLKKVQG